MPDPLLAPLLAAHHADAAAPLALPPDAAAQRAVFAAALDAIDSAIDANEVTAIEHMLALVWHIAHQTNDPEHVARAHWCSGVALLIRDHRAALEHYTAARPYFVAHGTPTDTARVLLGYGMAAGFRGQLTAADAALQHAMTLLADQPDHPHWMRLYLNATLVAIQQGDFARARTYAQHGVRAAALHQHRYIEASVRVNESIAQAALGQFAVAEATLQQAAQLAGDAAELQGRVAVNRARLATYRGNLFAALHWLQAAEQHFQSIALDIDRSTLAIEAAHLYERLHALREAYQYAVFAAEAFAESGLPPESVEARLLAIRLALARGRTREVPQHLAAATPLLANCGATWHALLAGYADHPAVRQRTAERHHALPRLDAAAATLHDLGAVAEHLDIALLAADTATALKLPDAAHRYATIASTAAAHGLVATEQRALLGQARHMRAAQACGVLRRAADITSRQRQQMPAEELKASLLRGGSAIYTHLIEAYLKSRQPDAAAATLLEAKGGAWADLAHPVPPAPPSAAWLAARTRLHTWQEEYYLADDAEYRAVCQQHIAAAEAALNAAARQQARPRPPQPIPTVADVQHALAPGQRVVEYLVGSRHIHACVLRPDAPPQWQRLAQTATVADLMGRFSLLVRSVQTAPTPDARRAAAAVQRAAFDDVLCLLYAALVEPLHASLPSDGTLLLAPDSLLFDVPWAALRPPDGDDLGTHYALHLLPSAAILGLGQPTAASPPPTPPAAFGYAGDPPLTHIAAELAALHQLAPSLQCHHPATTHDLARVNAPTWLHIAAHGRVRHDAPLLSQLVLADAPFLLADALRLPLHGTRFVTLSACETGTVPEQGGVLLALAGAFLVAGAGAVLASLWAVDDAATHHLMTAYYAAVQDGVPIAAALQQAQGTVRAAGYDHPLDWAAFQVLTRHP